LPNVLPSTFLGQTLGGFLMLLLQPLKEAYWVMFFFQPLDQENCWASPNILPPIVEGGPLSNRSMLCLQPLKER
jgi:hypothetical protein